MRLRSHLLVLTVATLLPMLVFVVIVFLVFAERERATFRRGATERTLALMTAVDSELKSSITTLEAIAASRSLDRADLKAFYDEAVRIMASQPDWLTVSLALPSGQQVVNVLRPFGAELPPILDRASFDRLLGTSKPAVSSLTTSPLTNQLDFAVRVPVVRAGDIKYVLSAVVKPETISQLLARQRLPADWVGVVLDGDARIVARTVAPGQTVGTLASESLRAALARGPEGWFRGSTIEGAEVFTPYNRSAFSGWTVAMGIPAAAVEAVARTTFWTMGAGLAIATGVALLLAFGLGRAIAGPIMGLAAAAKAIGHGREPTMPRSARVDEVQALGRALEDAGAAVRAREAAEREARRAAEAVNRTKDEFLAVLSHELRTPLTAAYGWTRMIQAQNLEGERLQKALDVISRSVDLQLRLVNDLLDVSALAAGKITLERRPVDLADIVRDELHTMKAAAAAQQVELNDAIAPSLPVEADPARLHQIVSNLLANALKFTPAGGQVMVAARRVEAGAEIEVSDNGRGIAPGLLPYIFDKFWQADASTTRSIGGLGLGLAIVRSLVDLHGGTVRVASEGEGRGATFTVFLPGVGQGGAPGR